MSGGAAELSATAAPRTISSRQTLFAKCFLPICLMLFGGAFLALWLRIWSKQPNAPSWFPWIYLAMLVVLSGLHLRMVMPLKKVSIVGTALVISNYRREITVPLDEIERVTETRWHSHHPVTIHLRHDTEFGRSITFMPKVRPFLFWRSHPIVSELRDLTSRPHQT